MTTDTERLDWLEKHRAMLNMSTDLGPHVWVPMPGGSGLHYYAKSYRAAIDEAIKYHVAPPAGRERPSKTMEIVRFDYAEFRHIHRRLRPEISDEEFRQLWDEYQAAFYALDPIKWDFEKMPERESVTFYKNEWREIFRTLRPDVNDEEFQKLWADFQATRRSGRQQQWI